MQHFIYRVAYGGIDGSWLDEVTCIDEAEALAMMRVRHGVWALLGRVDHWVCVDAVEVERSEQSEQQQGVDNDATNKRNEDAVDS